MNYHSQNLENFLEAFEKLKSKSEFLDEILKGFDPYNFSIKIDGELNYKIQRYIKFKDSE